MTTKLKKRIDSIAGYLVERGSTVAVAESVTAGTMQALFSNAQDASLFFQGGITVYNIGQKCRHLLVEPTHALQCNSVSGKVSHQMALSVCNLFSSDYGIGITGYASAVPEQNIHDLFSYVSIAAKGKIVVSEKIAAGNLKQEAVQLFYAEKAIALFCDALIK